MRKVTPMLGPCLAVILALTSGAMAVARGQTMAAGSIVLCLGTGPVAVAVDTNGQPAGPVHFCPDCALSLFDAAVPVPTTPPEPMQVASATFPQPAASERGLVLPAANARAPPAV